LKKLAISYFWFSPSNLKLMAKQKKVKHQNLEKLSQILLVWQGEKKTCFLQDATKTKGLLWHSKN
jgi:hypothetical protein